MHKRQITSALIGLFVAITFVGCPKTEDPKTEDPKKIRAKVEKEIGHGKLVGKTYANDYFNLKITFPETWFIASSQAETKELKKFNQRLVKEQRGANKAAWEAATANMLILVRASKFPPGTPNISFNAKMSIVAERGAHLPGIKTGADYLAYGKIMSRKQMKIKPNIQPIEYGQAIGSLKAACLPMSLIVQGTKVYQRMYATRVRDYILLVTITYTTPEERQTFEGLLKSMQASR